MRLFHLVRQTDSTGISGTGIVAEGVVYGDGTVIMRWRGPHTSIAIWPSVQQMLNVHGHYGDTRIEYLIEIGHNSA